MRRFIYTVEPLIMGTLRMKKNNTYLQKSIIFFGWLLVCTQEKKSHSASCDSHVTYHLVSLRLHAFLVTDGGVDLGESFLMSPHHLFPP